MALTAGQAILDGKYHILKLIGEGGMARVWLAEEPEFGGRHVAIKEPKREQLSPGELEEQERRFRLEVEMAALLQQAHAPHVVRALALERLEDGTPLLVMEYVEGGSLAELIAKHPNGIENEKAVQVSLDVCEALHAFHNLPDMPVHRDVKPSNILFDCHGQAYLADFGLAQLPGRSGRSTMTARPHPGTPLYMAPEQVRSPEPLTPSADLFSLGCVLFEMLTGKAYKRVKPGTTPSALQPNVPAWLDALAARLLQEDPWQRSSSAADVIAELRRAGRRWTTTPFDGIATLLKRRWQALPRHVRPIVVAVIVAATMVAVLALLGGYACVGPLAFLCQRPTPTRTLVPTSTVLPPGHTSSPGPTATATRTGTHTPTATVTRTLTATPTSTKPLTATPSSPPGPSGRILFASGDAQGTWLGVVDVRTGQTQRLADLGNFSMDMVTKSNAPQYAWVEDGSRFAYVYGPVDADDLLYLEDEHDGSKVSAAGADGLGALALSPDRSHLAYVAGECLRQEEGSWIPWDGPPLCYEYCVHWVHRIHVIDTETLDDRVLRANLKGEQYRGISWSPDGTQLAIISNESVQGHHRLWIINADGSGQRILTPWEGDYQSPAWSPDGALIAFSSNREGNYEIYTIAPDGTASRRLTDSKYSDFTPSWSPDGNWLAFCSDRDGGFGIWVMDRQGERTRRVVAEHSMWPVWGR